MVIHHGWRVSVKYCVTVWLLAVPAFAAETQPSTQTTAITFNVAELFADPADSKPAIQRQDALQKAIDAATTPLDQAAAHLALANWVLAVPTARPATRLLMGYPVPGDTAKFAEAAQTAKANLEIARTLLKPEAPEAKDRRRTLKSAATTLEAFAKGFAAIGSVPSNGSCTPCGDAVLDLAAAREAEDANTAAAALLWQSLGWELAGKRERALTSLPNTLEKPEHLPYDFMSRLLRCRLVAEGGPNAAAVALTIRIRSLCEKWFPRQEGEALEERRRLVDILQYQFLREWIKEVPSGNEATVQKLQAMLDETKKRLVTEGDAPKVYFLESSIPILVEPSKLKPPAPTAPLTASQPASLENESQPELENTSTNPASE